MYNCLIDTITEQIERMASMAGIAGVEFSIFCSKVSLDTKVLQIEPLVETIVWKTIGYPNFMVSSKGDAMNQTTKKNETRYRGRWIS